MGAPALAVCSGELVNVKARSTKSDVREALGTLKSITPALAIMSGVVNILALTGSFYMMQVYDRVDHEPQRADAAGAVDPGAGAVPVPGLLRHDPLAGARAGGGQARQEARPAGPQGGDRMPRFGFRRRRAWSACATSTRCAASCAGRGRSALFDLPWIPVYLAFVFMLHPWLGIVTFSGAMVLAVLTICSERMMRKPAKLDASGVDRAHDDRRGIARNADVLQAMGFGNLVARFKRPNASIWWLQTKTERHRRGRCRPVAGVPDDCCSRRCSARRVPDHARARCRRARSSRASMPPRARAAPDRDGDLATGSCSSRRGKAFTRLASVLAQVPEVRSRWSFRRRNQYADGGERDGCGPSTEQRRS